jgi:hypothetical protein
MILALTSLSCEKKEDATPQAPQTQQVQATPAQPAQPVQAAAAAHTGVVQEVLQANAYTYLKIKENDTESWIAIPKRESKVGETVSFAQGLEMRDFKSKDLDRTFASVYFVSGVNGQAATATADPQTALTPHHQKTPADKLDITIEPVEGGLSLAALFANRAAHADKTVTVKGKVTKVNRAIMGKNWVHLQDGTSDAGDYSLTITTEDEIKVDEVVALTGTITLNKDFGAGYKYDIIMQDAKQNTE